VVQEDMMLLNAFSLNMVADLSGSVSWEAISLDEARKLLATGFESAVGHESTAAVFADQLGVSVEARRVTVALSSGDTALVGQYRGLRLPEGATALPDGATITWFRIILE